MDLDWTFPTGRVVILRELETTNYSWFSWKMHPKPWKLLKGRFKGFERTKGTLSQNFCETVIFLTFFVQFKCVLSIKTSKINHFRWKIRQGHSNRPQSAESVILGLYQYVNQYWKLLKRQICIPGKTITISFRNGGNGVLKGITMRGNLVGNLKNL